MAKANGIADRKNYARIVSVEPRYNLLFRMIEEDLVPMAMEEGIGIISYNPLAGGLLTGRYKKDAAPEEGTRFGLGIITTKIWISNYGYENAKKSIEESLERLQLDYLDLLLIHQPFNDYYGTYRAMEELYKEGKLKAIGVSNFYPDRLIDLIKYNEIVPAVNQVETHPFNQQVKAHEIMKKYGVQIQAWAPFAEGRNNLFSDATLKAVGDKYNKSNAQVALRYLIQRGVSVITKTVNKERMIQNIDVFDFELTKEDMDVIATLDKAKTLFFSHNDPDEVERLTSLVRKF